MRAVEFYNELWQIEKEIKEHQTSLETLLKRKSELKKIKRLDLK